MSCDAMLWKVCMMLLCENVGYEHVNFDIMIRTRIWKFIISLVCFTRGDFVMLISHKKGYDERTVIIKSKRSHGHVIQGDNILLPMLCFFIKDKLKVISRKKT